MMLTVYIALSNLSTMHSKVTSPPLGEPARPFLLLGNHPALDFLNTAPVEHGQPAERLTDYAALVAWADQVGLVAPDDAARARERWGASPAGAGVVARARALRSLWREVVERVAGGGAPTAALLARLNAALREEAGAYTEVRGTNAGFERRTKLKLDAPGELLTPLLRAMGALLTDVDLALVRKCESAACVLFFYDVSKNHARRWCSMENCGNRHKVNAYRARGGRVS